MNIKHSLVYFFILLAFLSYAYMSGNGIKTANGGGHFALAKAAVFDRTFEVDKYIGIYVHKPDYATKNGKIYSDRLPGNAILISGFLGVSNTLNLFGINRFLKLSEPEIPICMLMPALAGALALLCFILLLNLLSFNVKTIATSSLFLGFGTLLHHESSHLFSHAASCLFATLAFLLTLVVDQQKDKHLSLVTLLAGVLGFSLLIELQNILFVLPIFLYLIDLKSVFKQKNLQITAILSLSILVFLGLLLSYNYVTFGEFILKSNTYNPFFPEEKSFLTALSGNPLDGIDRLLFSFQFPEVYFDWWLGVTNDTPGVFVASPVYLLSLPGYVILYREHKRLFWLLVCFLLIAILVAGFHVTTLVRHISTVYVLLFLPFPFLVKKINSIALNRKVIFWISCFIVFGLSAGKEWYINAHYWGRNYSFLEFPYAENYVVLICIGFPLFGSFYWLFSWIYNKNLNL